MLLLWRYRQRTRKTRILGRIGPVLSRGEAAEMLGLSSGNYIKLEEGRTTTLELRADDIDKQSDALDRLSYAMLSVGDPSLREKCFLARRRAHMTLRQAREALGVSSPGYHLLERRGDARVVAFWESHGYRF